MSARVLVVDDVLPNVKILEAKLISEYFDVITASNGPEALEKVRGEHPDIVLLDVMMPGMDGFEVCRRMKSDPALAHIPVVMVTALREPSDRVQGLEAGADDFLTKPVNDVALFARVRSLVRLKMMMDELRLREKTSLNFGLLEESREGKAEDFSGGRVLVIDDYDISAEMIQASLEKSYTVAAEADPEEARLQAMNEDFDLIIVSLGITSFDPLRFCSQIRTSEQTRNVPVLILVDEEDTGRLAKGLELGVTDYVTRPIDRNELVARVRTQIRRKRYQDQLRQNYHLSMEMAVTDSLTGLYNRRYMLNHLENLMSRGADGFKPMSLLMLDIDHFKSVNDTYGHMVGDEVLKEFAERVRLSVRGVDLASRCGGEEFVIIMPDTDTDTAWMVAERLRANVADKPFTVSGDKGSLTVTCSIGVATMLPGEDPDSLMGRADEGLYAAKKAGRNKVCRGETG